MHGFAVMDWCIDDACTNPAVAGDDKRTEYKLKLPLLFMSNILAMLVSE